MRVACIGECMIELSGHPDGSVTQAFGGDTLNTALYLARLGVTVDYVTALGDDPWSEAMLAAWTAEGIGTRLVRRMAGRVPGLYWIRTDAAGERSFHYWRDQAPARELFAGDVSALVAELAGFDLVYYSGISLSLYGDAGRAVLAEALAGVRRAGGRVAFDTNYRARGWPDRAVAQAAFAAALGGADLIFASPEDLVPVFGPDGATEALRHRGQAEIVLKSGGPEVRVLHDGGDTRVAVPPAPAIVDTTAAGDSFAAGYLAARARGENPERAARAGHRLAGVVIGYRGAVIPLAAMPSPEAPPPEQTP
jgi:2-dehydro-3-deoxygluconokinase